MNYNLFSLSPIWTLKPPLYFSKPPNERPILSFTTPKPETSHIQMQTPELEISVWILTLDPNP